MSTPILQPEHMLRNLPADASQARAEERDVPSSGSLPVTQAIADPSAGGSVLPALVSICGWCDGAAEQTRALRAAGHDVTHGICPSRAERVRTGSTARGQGSETAILMLTELVEDFGKDTIARWLENIAAMKGVEL